MVPKSIAMRSGRRTAPQVLSLEADICVVGAGIAGLSAALEAARLGRRVILVDGAQELGGQSVGSMIGTFCGLYSNGPGARRITHGIADEILAYLDAHEAAHYLHRRRNTTIVQYRIQALARWAEEAVHTSSIELLLGAVVRRVEREDRRIRALAVATRYGDVEIRAQGFVDASGDAILAWLAGLEVREPAQPIYGSLMISLEGVDDDASASARPRSAACAPRGKGGGLRACPARWLRIQLSRSRRDARQHDAFRNAARSPRRFTHGARRPRAGRPPGGLSQGRVSGDLFRRTRQSLWVARHTPDPLDRRSLSIDGRGRPRGPAFCGRRRALQLAD